MSKKTLLLLALAVPVLTMGAGCSVFNKDTQIGQTPVTPVANVELSVSSTNEFKISDLKVGLEIAGLKVTSFGPFNVKTGPISAENLTVSFEGTKTVTGIYSGTENSAMGGPATFSLDKASAQSLPRLTSSNKANVFFSFSNLDTSAITKLGKVEKSATIVIKNYTINHWPAEVFNTAYLVEVKENTPSSLNKYSNDNYTFEYPQAYEIKQKTQPVGVNVEGKNGRLEIFQLKKPNGERSDEVDFGGAVNPPQKLKRVENKETWFDVWMYYDANDKQTEDELMAIFDSIKLK